MAKEVKKSETLNLLMCEKTTINCSCLSCVCCGRAFSHRLILSIMLISGIILAYSHRVCINLAITEMTIPQNISKHTTVDPEACKSSHKDTRPVIWDIEGGKFDWDEQTQSYVLLSFYIGYLFCNIPGGYLCDHYSAKWVLLGGFMISTVGTLITPLVAIYTSWHCIVIVRILMGVGQAPVFPGATLLISRWIPPAERTLVGGVVLSSLSVGTILGSIPTAFILEGLRSWVWVFYIYGIVGVVFCILFGIFIYSSPDEHPFITAEEKEYLSSRIATKEKHKVPIAAILKDLTVWSCIFGQIGNDYTLYTIITNFPKYLTDVLKYSSKDAGLLVCIPQLALFIGSISSGAITDVLIVHWGIKIVDMRMANTFIATVLPAIGLLICCKVRCARIWAITAVTTTNLTKGMYFGGLKITIIDITSYHTGLVAAIVNTAAGIAGTMVPYKIGQIASENTFEQWDLIAYITLLVSLILVLPYMFFCKAERKVWDYEPGAAPAPDPDAKTGWVSILSCVNKH